MEVLQLLIKKGPQMGWAQSLVECIVRRLYNGLGEERGGLEVEVKSRKFWPRIIQSSSASYVYMCV